MYENHGKSLLVVVAKAPEPGKVKTRLTPQLSPEEAAALYGCFLQDRISAVSTLDGIDLAIAFTPDNAGDAFAGFAKNGLKLFPQKGGDLGERLNNIFLDRFSEGYDSVAVVDSDSPDLPAEIMLDSFDRLHTGHADVVLGPCMDGGYYLVGMRRPHPGLFDDIPWSTGAVLERTMSKAERLRLRTDLLPVWSDLDTFEDLVAFYSRHRDQPAEGKKSMEFISCLQKIVGEVR